MEHFMKQQSPKSTLLADNTRNLITTKQTKLRPVASAAPHPITPAHVIMRERGGEYATRSYRKVFREIYRNVVQ